MVHSKNVKVEIKSEEALSREPARVLVYENGQLVAEVIAKIEPKEGADGGHYPCVTLEGVMMRKAKLVLHHDDPSCTTRLNNGFCPECDLVPDMQSTCLYLYCPLCDCRLGKKLKCPKCKRIFKHPNP